MEEFTNLSNEIVSFDVYRHQLRDEILRVLEEEEDFEIVQHLGEGSYGQVIAVNCPYHEETVALKIVHFGDSWDGELELWPTLDHQNILPLLNFIRFPEADLFITPVMYEDMETILETESFIYDPDAFDFARKWLRDVLDAIDYLHKKKLCHLDIKADNVLIDYNCNAVLCDFSFICQSGELIVRYGTPIPYRPPEACLAMEMTVPVDGMKFDMWTYGILALNVLTKHFIKMRVNEEIEKWHRDMYPLFYAAMGITYFRYLMSTAFPASNTEYEFSEAFNFVQFILRLQPEDRPSTEDTINHIFLKEGRNRLEIPDDIWIIEETFECLCVKTLESITDYVMFNDNFEKYKFKKSRIHYKKARKWKKTSTILNTKELIAEYTIDVSKLFFEANDRKFYEKRDENSCRLEENSMPEKSEKTVEAQSEFNVSGDMPTNDRSDDKIVSKVPCGKDPSHMLLATIKKEATEKDLQVKNKVNKITESDVKANKEDILDHEILLNTTAENEVSNEMVTVETETEFMTSNDKLCNDTSDDNIFFDVTYRKDPSHILMATEKDSQVKIKDNEATENDVEANKSNILHYEIFLNTATENEISNEIGKTEKLEALKMETNKTSTLSSILDVAEKGLHANGLRKWIKEKINVCTSNVMRMIRKPKEVKEIKSENPSPID